MKRCSYCGVEYPDDATECPVDKTPFGESNPERFHIKRPTFAIFSEHKIPVSLAIVSYFFFMEAAACFAYIAFMVIMAVFLFPNLFEGIGAEDLLACIVVGAIGIFWLLLSRGLRRCSRGWRICALVLTWWWLIAGAFDVIRYFITHKTPGDYSTSTFFSLYTLGFVTSLWQYRVLTRPDVRDLFGV